jgi:putative Mg2+ transporter-C (MgtC) family protein
MLLDFTLNIGAALVLGAVIGLERQWRQRMAGLRTNALVSTGAAMFVAVSALVSPDTSPTRVAAQVVSGIGFLGAGVIMREGLNIRGLNTAATLWCAAGVGVLAGTGHLAYGAVGAAMVLMANLLLRPLARVINFQNLGGGVSTDYAIRIVCLSESEQHIRALLLQVLTPSELKLRSLHSEDEDNPSRTSVRAELTCDERCDQTLEQVVSRLSLERGVTAVRWDVLGFDEI